MSTYKNNCIHHTISMFVTTQISVSIASIHTTIIVLYPFYKNIFVQI